MKKFLSLGIFIITLIFAGSANAGKLDIDIGLLAGQQDLFKSLSKELGSGASYKATNPAGALAGGLKPIAFDLGLEVSFIDIDDGSAYWALAAPDAPSLVPVPKLHAIVGLPMGIDIGAIYSRVPNSSISLIGFSGKYTVIKDSITLPAVAVRGTYTKVTGIDDLDFSTKSIDVSVSKKLTVFTPYAGVGQVWVDSEPSVVGLVDESFSETKYFVGAKLKLALVAITGEAEFAEVSTYTVKLSAGF
ncbi:MAG: DUF6588 family protein [Thermodesulfobacteriota bacterium]